MRQEQNIDRVIKKIESLPTLPIISQKVIEIAGNENTSFKDLVSIIEKDQSLTLKILKVANSSFYSFLSKVTSLESALVKLGFNEVRSIVLGISVYRFFSDTNGNGFERKLFWEHAIICSQIAKYLNLHFRLPNDDSLFLSGLIHDMGKIVVDQYLHEEFVQIIEDLSTGETTFSKAEKKILGTTHYQISAKLLKQWKFPKKVIFQVLYHHAPWYAKDFEANSIIIYLSNILTKMAGYTCHPAEKRLTPEEFAKSAEMEYLNKSGFELDGEILKNLINNIREYIKDESDSVMRLLD